MEEMKNVSIEMVQLDGNRTITIPEKQLSDMTQSIGETVGFIETAWNVKIRNNKKGTTSIYMVDDIVNIASVIYRELSDVGEEYHEITGSNVTDFDGDIPRYEFTINQGDFTVSISALGHILPTNIICVEKDKKLAPLKFSVHNSQTDEYNTITIRGVQVIDFKDFKNTRLSVKENEGLTVLINTIKTAISCDVGTWYVKTHEFKKGTHSVYLANGYVTIATIIMSELNDLGVDFHKIEFHKNTMNSLSMMDYSSWMRHASHLRGAILMTSFVSIKTLSPKSEACLYTQHPCRKVRENYGNGVKSSMR